MVVVVPLRRPAVCFLTPLTEEHGGRRRNRLGLALKRREEREVEVLGSNRSVLGGGGGGGWLFGYLSNIANYPMALPYKTLLIIKLLNHN